MKDPRSVLRLPHNNLIIYLIICLAFWVTNCSQVSGVCQGIKQKFDRIVVESVSGK